MLKDFKAGRKFDQSDLNEITDMPGEQNPLGELLTDELEEGLLTGEAEKLTVRDLLRHKQRHVGTDGPHNQLIRTRSSGDFFRTGTPEQLITALETHTVNMERMSGFFRRCSQADYIPEDKRAAMAELSRNITGSMLPVTKDAVAQMSSAIRAEDDISLSTRLALKNVYNSIHDVLYPLSEIRVNIHEAYVRGQSRQCTFVDSWGSP